MPHAAGQPPAAPSPPPSLSPPSPASPASPASPPKPRLLSLDVFRGLTIAAMLVVNNPGTWAAVYPPLRHAAWDGCTPTDLIFPFFLWIVGVAMAFSFAAPLADPARRTTAFYLGIARRAALLIGLGLFLAFFGLWSLDTLRLPGVLQRIGICFALASLVVLFIPRPAQYALVALTLLGTFALHVLVPVPWPASAGGTVTGDLGENLNLARFIDQQLLPAAHLYRNGAGTEPEGLLGTACATATVMLGFWVGCAIRTAVTSSIISPAASLAALLPRLLALGAALTAAGWLWAGAPSPLNWFTSVPSPRPLWLCPLNKPLWSASYTLFTAGLATISLVALLWLLEVRRSTSPLPAFLRPALWLGTNAIAAYVLAGILARLFTRIITWPAPLPDAPARTTSLWAWLSQNLTQALLPGPAGSLLQSLLLVGSVTVVMWYFHHRRWFLKV
jgi:predicted acyltransferase